MELLGTCVTAETKEAYFMHQLEGGLAAAHCCDVGSWGGWMCGC